MQQIKLEGVNEFVLYEKMKNGLDVYLLPNKNVKNFYITFNTKFGSIHTEFKKDRETTLTKIPSGVAHFLEHLTFKMPDGDASDYFANLGSMSNAYTSFKVTCYEVFAYELFKENLEYLLDFVQYPYFNNKLVEGEKGIIVEELKMYDDQPETLICNEMNRCLFKKDNRKNVVGGSISDVKKTTLKDIESAYNTFYNPSNMFLIITGNFNPDEALAIIEENQAKRTFKEINNIKIKSISEPASVATKYKCIDSCVAIDKVNIGLKIPLSNFKSLNLSDVERNIYISMILYSMFGRSSEIQEMLVSGNIITDGLVVERFFTDEYLIINLIAETPYPKRFISLIDEKLKKFEIKEEDLERKKRVAISNYILSFDDIEETNNSIQSDIINYGKIQNNLLEIYNQININTATSIAEKMTDKNKSIVILKTKEDE